ncbi:LysR family transcriptional regulator [Niveibacterium umoris]|uniref:DNA-binding transcriptional LysR family regulator n=1 Tax=Niveibacterium umoris TaxID=1193620 RepID=A0A840BV47_9RHOO|nr:LysR family transcriptional regulator [Niveibacterium umoris]MBB4014686.1 DNA-binding transcriptional LysR family regulator [Niveibacterium umoris]
MADLNGIDLNLLVALQALMQEAHVTRAAERLGVTQPAMSRTLGRLRALFGDPLFVRTPSGLKPTPRAEALRERLDATLADVAGLIAPPLFDPAQARGRWCISTTDYGANSMLPRVVERLHREAPQLDLTISAWRDDQGYRQLESGEAQLALATVAQAPAGIHGRGLGDDQFVCLLRAGHAALSQDFDLETFLKLPQILIHLGGADPRGVVDLALERIGRARRVAVRVANFMAALSIAARSDMVVSVPRTLARLYGSGLGLVEREVPLDLPRIRYALLWHERLHHDPGHSWLRTLCFEEITRALADCH